MSNSVDLRSEEGTDKDAMRLDQRKLFPHLRCDKCQDFFREDVYSCEGGHSTCSLCCSESNDGAMPNHAKRAKSDRDGKNERVWECPVEGCNFQTTTNSCKNLALIVQDLKLDVPCKNREAGCGIKAARDKIDLHEDECDYREVACCNGMQFQHLTDHFKEEHGVKISRWVLAGKLNQMRDDHDYGHKLYKHAYKFENGPDGKLFYTVVRHEANLRAFVYVMGGKQEAKKYRVEFIVTSGDTTVSLTHNGPVFPIDLLGKAQEQKECFEMSASRFKFFNQDHEYFGTHNKNQLGEYALPIETKIIKKEPCLMTPD